MSSWSDGSCLRPAGAGRRTCGPIAGTARCQFHHVGLVLSGAMDGRMDDGTEFTVRPGDVFDIETGHDNWVIDDEAVVVVIWGGWRGWGKRRSVSGY